MILVTGANGTVGKEVVKQLSAAGAEFRVLVRDAKKAEGLKGPDVDVAVGDFADKASLSPALKGVEKVFLLSVADPRQGELQGNVVKAAKAAGVAHVVKLSALGADEKSPVNFARWHRQTEKEIEVSGLAWTHLRPHFFMQNTLMFADSVKKEGTFYAPMKDGKVSLVDARDIAAVAVKTLTEKGHEGKTYAITGPEALSFREVADRLSTAVGKPVKYVDVSPVDAQKAMMRMGMPGWLIEGLIGLYAVFSADRAAAVSPTVKDVAKRPGILYAQFAKDHAAAFN